VVTNPPIIPALIGAVYARLTRASLILDDHPGAFGAMGYRIGAAMRPLHRRLVAQARLCLVTDRSWVDVIRSWGGEGLVLHEAPATWTPAAHPCGAHPRVLFVCTFARDEPAAEVIQAARQVPELHVLITGDVRHRPAGDQPENVEFVGFLDPDAYREAVEAADVILTLTTEPTSAMRAAFEAVWAEKVLVVSDWPLLHSLFPEAVHVGHTPEAIAEGLRVAVADHARRSASAPAARERQLGEWADQLLKLRTALADKELTWAKERMRVVSGVSRDLESAPPPTVEVHR
jgi:hypothetical protein